MAGIFRRSTATILTRSPPPSRPRRTDGRPSLIACRTVIGYGAPNKAGTAGSHGAPLGEDEIAGAREALDWDLPPFELPEDVVAAWQGRGESIPTGA